MRKRFLVVAAAALLAMSLATIEAAADEPAAEATTEIMEMAEKVEEAIEDAEEKAEIAEVMEEIEAVEEAEEAAEEEMAAEEAEAADVETALAEGGEAAEEAGPAWDEAEAEATEAAEEAEEEIDDGTRSAGTGGNPGEEMVTWILPKSTYELFNLVNEHEPMDATGTEIYNDQIHKSMAANAELYPSTREFVDWRAPRGKLIKATLEDSEFYPGTSHDYLVYVPKAYDPEKPAKLVVFYDGQNFIPKHGEYPDLFKVFDNMIA